MAHGPDGPLIEYWRSQLIEARELQRIDPKDCIAYFFPMPTDTTQLATLLSAETKSTEYARLTDLITAAADQPARTPLKGEIQTALDRAAEQTSTLMPGAMRILANGRESAPPAELCTATLLFYSEILRLPPPDAGAVLRFLAAAN